MTNTIRISKKQGEEQYWLHWQMPPKQWLAFQQADQAEQKELSWDHFGRLLLFSPILFILLEASIGALIAGGIFFGCQFLRSLVPFLQPDKTTKFKQITPIDIYIGNSEALVNNQRYRYKEINVIEVVEIAKNSPQAISIHHDYKTHYNVHAGFSSSQKHCYIPIPLGKEAKAKEVVEQLVKDTTT